MFVRRFCTYAVRSGCLALVILNFLKYCDIDVISTKFFPQFCITTTLYFYAIVYVLILELYCCINELFVICFLLLWFEWLKFS